MTRPLQSNVSAGRCSRTLERNGRIRGSGLDRKGASRYTPSHLLPVLGLPSRLSILNSPELQVIRVKRPFRCFAEWVVQPHRLLSPTREDKSWAVARDVGGGSRGRRKEVALGRLITVSLILILAHGEGLRKAHPLMTRPQRHPRRSASRRPCRRSSISKLGRVYLTVPRPQIRSNWPPSIWRPPILIVISSNPTSSSHSTSI